MNEPRIGNLDHRLNLKSAALTADGAGGGTLAWSLVAELWGSLTPLGGAERLDAVGLKGRVTHEVWIRHRDGVKPEMRFELGTRVFDIRAVLEAGQRRRYLKCLVEERVS